MRPSYRIAVLLAFLVAVSIHLTAQNPPKNPNGRPLVVAAFVPQPGMDSGFMTYIVPQTTINAVMERYDWVDLNPSQGVYDFSQIDSDIAKWRGYNKQTVVLVSLVSDQVGPSVPNTATPGWVLSQVPMETCSYLGANSIPVMYDPRVMAFTQPFILALLEHLDTQAPWVAYARVGLWEGGENCPLCRANMPDGEQTMFDYLQTMSNYIHTNHPKGTRLAENCSACLDSNYTLQSGTIFTSESLGIGQEDLSAQDTNSATCPWCETFSQHPNSPRYLQPADPQPDSAFMTYYALAESYKVNAIELPVYPTLAIAYIPSYTDSYGGYNKYHAQYQSSLSH